MRRFLYPILAVVVSVLFYLYENKLDTDYYNDYKEEVKDSGSTSSFDYLPKSTNNQIVEHAYYTLSYNEQHEQPDWVAYELKLEHTAYNDLKRPYFEEDPLVKTISASWKNYKRSGYDKGHLCPAADRRFNKKAHDETFLTSNISPQEHKFNAGIWNDLEKKIRQWVKKDKRLYIVTGPVFGSSKKTIGSEHVTVPNHFFKIILKYGNGKPKMMGFLMPHNTTSRNLKEFVLPVDKIESLVGHDFFYELPDSIEKELESVKSSDWSL